MPLFRRRSTNPSTHSSSTSSSSNSSTYPSVQSSKSTYPFTGGSNDSNLMVEGSHVPTLINTFFENFKYRWVLPKKEKRIRARILLQYSSHCLLWLDRILKWENPWLTFAIGYLWTILCHFYALIYSVGPGWISLAMLVGYMYIHFSFFPKNEKPDLFNPSASTSTTSSRRHLSISQARTNPKSQTPPSLLESTRELTYFTYTITQKTSDMLVYCIDLLTWEHPVYSQKVLMMSLLALPCWWLFHCILPSRYVICILGWCLLIAQHPMWWTKPHSVTSPAPSMSRSSADVYMVLDEILPVSIPLLPPRLPTWIEQYTLPADGPLPPMIQGILPQTYFQILHEYQLGHFQHVQWVWQGPWMLHAESIVPSNDEDLGTQVQKRIWVRKAKCTMS
ncbi:hypothetical protein HMI54_005602 [Coelomomyces lativittatus]|nr:hypothetical protein HMI55_003077 [Coelomomyces lativittatus]KAJ1505250.1 hypothetical protein HMI56_001224 [Coelomomyces lativittatus]KAJ1505868.1 hypothetical protein HMI54_005602 [Coelomomyces lativittatus]